MDPIVALRLAISLAIGLIIGMERGWESRESPQGLRSAGIRSFGFVGLLGGITALLTAQLGVGVLAIAFLGLSLLVAVSYVLITQRTQDFGITTELALLLTFMLGALTGKGLLAEAVAVAVVITALLGFKQELHQSLQRLDRRELVATLQLLLIAAVVLPLLPNRNLGPWNSLNPRAIGLLVVLIAGISYVGYFAMRLWGARVGILATAVLGALVSSTAVTVSFGRMARREQKNFALLGAGISLASGTMALRILMEVSIVNPLLLPSLVPPLACLAIVPLIAAGAIAIRTRTTEASTEVKLKNPIELTTALGYGTVFAVLFVLIRAMEAWFGNAGVYALAAISGITDVDAVSLSLAQATKGDLPLVVGTTGILIAAMVNTIVKALLATIIGGWKLAQWCASILLLALGLSVITALFIHF
uniref:MgtC/SapB family protein n=1 Tax=Oscillatoriales cyanobacterium SpSt-402 TaxID=2282168 RepID=A0A832H3Y3_9CYAN